MKYINMSYITMKLILFIIVFLLLPILTYSAQRDTAIITLTIINLPPVINNVSFSSSDIYSDMEVTCYADIFDEDIKNLKIEYSWYINDFQKAAGQSFSGFNENDYVSCRVTATDSAGVKSKEVGSGFFVKQVPQESKLIKNFVNSIGGKIDLKKANELNNDGVISITGFVISENVSNGNIIIVLAVLVIVLLLINVRMVLKERIRRTQQKN